MILLAALVALLFVDKLWIRIVAIVGWVAGLAAHSREWPLYLIATAMVMVVFLIARTIVKATKKK